MSTNKPMRVWTLKQRALVTLGSILIVVAMTFAILAATLAYAQKASAKAVNLEPAVRVHHKNPTTYVEHVERRWFYVELADGSAWAITRCRYEDGRNCWWNAKRRGNGRGCSFATIRGVQHWWVEDLGRRCAR